MQGRSHRRNAKNFGKDSAWHLINLGRRNTFFKSIAKDFLSQHYSSIIFLFMGHAISGQILTFNIDRRFPREIRRCFLFVTRAECGRTALCNKFVNSTYKNESKVVYSQNMELPISILLKSVAPNKIAYFIKCLQMLTTQGLVQRKYSKQMLTESTCV